MLERRLNGQYRLEVEVLPWFYGLTMILRPPIFVDSGNKYSASKSMWTQVLVLNPSSYPCLQNNVWLKSVALQPTQ